MRSNKAVFILFLLLGLAVFSNGLTGEFVHDDILVLSHSFFSQPSKIFSFFSQPYFESFVQAGLYRPLTQISFALNFLIGSSPFSFHLVNVLLHIINSFLVFLLLKKLTDKNQFSLIAAMLFLVLPIHVEAVTSIVGRAELLLFFFGTATLILWLNSKYFLSAVALFSALLSKETAVAIPAITFLFSWYYQKRGVARLGVPHSAQIAIEHYGGKERQAPEFWRWLSYYLGALGLYFGMRIAVLGEYAFKTKVEFVFNPLAHISFFERFFTASKVLVLYLVKTFAPYRLSADYSYDQIPIVTNLFTSPLALFGFLVLGLMLWTIFRILLAPTPNSRIMVWGWALILFLLPYLVISNLVFPAGTIMADRLMYFPSLGMVLILGLVLERLLKFSKKPGTAVLLTLIIIYGLLTVNQNKIWASRESLITNMYEKSPNSVVAKTEFGILILSEDKDLAKRLSFEVYEKYPDYIQNLNLRGAVKVQEGNFTEAEKFLERALELRPKHQNTLQNLSRIYFTLGEYQKAEEILKVLVSEYGGLGNVIFYALVQAKNGRFAESRQTLYSFFGPEINDESALKILRGELRELESFYIFGK